MRARLAFALATLALAAGCDSLPGKPDPADRPLRPADVKDFAVLYADNCSGCHGADGRMGAAATLADPVYLALVSDDDLRAVITGGVPGTAMPPFAVSAGGQLTDAQVDILVREMRARWGAAGAPRDAGSTPAYTAARALAAGETAGDPARGATAYATYCQGCHGPDGAGGKAGSIVDGSYLALVSDQSLRTTVIVGRPGFGMPDWRGYVPGRPMSGQEVSDVVAWLASRRVEYPGPDRR